MLFNKVAMFETQKSEWLGEQRMEVNLQKFKQERLSNKARVIRKGSERETNYQRL